VTNTQGIETKVKQTPLPDLGDIIFLAFCQLMLFILPNLLFGDGSTGWHLVTGQFILKTFSIPHHDLISYTFANAPWVAYEWLSDLLMAIVVNLGGLPLLGVFVSVTIAYLYLFLYEDCRRQGSHFLLAATITIIGALAASIHWQARPHIFTFWGIYIFSKFLEEFHQGKISFKKLLVIIVATTIFWANLHPAFIIGIALLGIYFVSTLLIALFAQDKAKRQLGGKQSREYGITLLAALAATLVNPYGVGLHAYIFKYLHASTVISNTDEFQSPVFHGSLQPSCLEILFLFVFVGLVTTRKMPSLPKLLAVLAFGHLALSSLRNVPLFVIVALPFIASLFAQASLAQAANDVDDQSLLASDQKTPQWQNFWRRCLTWWRQTGTNFDAIEPTCQMHLLPIIYTVVLVSMVYIGGSSAGNVMNQVGFDQKRMPSKTLAYLSDHHLDPKQGLNLDNWGGYMAYKLGIPVFIDDRADFYPESFYLDYAQAMTLTSRWSNVLDKYKIQWALLPQNSRLGLRLQEDPSWQLACQDKASCLFVRKQAQVSQPVSPKAILPASVKP
jgi:hypothetical protein